MLLYNNILYVHTVLFIKKRKKYSKVSKNNKKNTNSRAFQKHIANDKISKQKLDIDITVKNT
jgi:hypothetical protein